MQYSITLLLERVIKIIIFLEESNEALNKKSFFSFSVRKDHRERINMLEINFKATFH